MITRQQFLTAEAIAKDAMSRLHPNAAPAEWNDVRGQSEKELVGFLWTHPDDMMFIDSRDGRVYQLHVEEIGRAG